MIQNTNDYIIEKKLLKQIVSFLAKCESNIDVEQTSTLSRFIKYTFDYISKSNIKDFETINDVFHHKYTTDCIGTFKFIRSYNPKTKESFIFISEWDWKIDPNVFSKIYDFVLQSFPIYEDIEDAGCGFIKIKDARGYENYRKNNKTKPLSKIWFKNVKPYHDINGYVYAYVLLLNGDVRIIDKRGMTHDIIDNYERQHAESLFESLIKQIVRHQLLEHFRKRSLNEISKKRLNSIIDRTVRRVLREHISKAVRT